MKERVTSVVKITANYLKLKYLKGIASMIFVMILLLPMLGYAATNGDWTGTTDQSLPISFSVSGDTASNIMTRLRVFCPSFSVLVIQNLGSAAISNNSFTASGTTSACTPSPPFSYRPYSFTCSFIDETTCQGAYDYNSSQAGTWEATVPSCDRPEITNFSASPDTIDNGNSSTLNWSITDATSASINEEIGPVSATNDSISVSPISTTTYTLSATNSCGTVNAYRTVSVSQSNQGLVAEYLFNGDANDTSGNGLDGTVFGATLTTDRFGRENRAYFFDGANDYIHLPSSNVFYPSSGFTWTVWMKPNGYGGAIISAGDTVGCEDFQLGIGEHPPNDPVFNENAAWATIDNVGGCSERNILDYVIPGGINTNQFYHLALRVDFNNDFAELYLDGIKVDTVNISGNINSRNMLMTIGAFRDQDNIHGMLFDGVLDDIHFYNQVLSETEISNLANDITPRIQRDFPWTMFIPAITGGKDCNGVRSGKAYVDNCGNCVGGTTGKEPCIQDCNGTWGGGAVIDECGVCGGNGPPCPQCSLTCDASGFTYTCGSSSSQTTRNYCYMGSQQYVESLLVEYSNGYFVNCTSQYCSGPLTCNDNTNQSCIIQ